MQEFNISTRKNQGCILALGAESAGNFSIYKNDKIYFSEDFGDLQESGNFKKYKFSLNKFLKENDIKPNVILSDLHPLFLTTKLAKDLAKKYKAEYVPVQHHIAHIFSSVGDKLLEAKSNKPESDFIGIACDGTGFGFDEKIWGGEIFSFQLSSSSFQANRIGHLENQILIGGELAIKEPARVLISILSKFQNKKGIYSHVKKFYSKNEFELLWNQLEQNFNCLETSSTARILDAVSILLGFSKNERLSKHGPVQLLEKNSSEPYSDLKPKVKHEVISHQSSIILDATYLFEYLIKNLDKNKKRLASTAQKYIADGLNDISKNLQPISDDPRPVFFAGGMANNKIISDVMEKRGVYMNKKIPRGDAGISFGQIIYHLTDSRH